MVLTRRGGFVISQLVGGLAWVVAALRLQRGMDSSEGGQVVA
jgi:hypothetical protein